MIISNIRIANELISLKAKATSEISFFAVFYSSSWHNRAVPFSIQQLDGRYRATMKFEEWPKKGKQLNHLNINKLPPIKQLFLCSSTIWLLQNWYVRKYILAVHINLDVPQSIPTHTNIYLMFALNSLGINLERSANWAGNWFVISYLGGC